MKKWIISGAGSGAGKTHLALALCRILPEAVYAKRGHCPSKPGKPGNYFSSTTDLKVFIEACCNTYQHAVIESNSLALEGYGDIVVYIQEYPGISHIRPDAEQLHEAADILVGQAGSRKEWEAVLQDVLSDESRCTMVCNLLEEHKLFVTPITTGNDCG